MQLCLGISNKQWSRNTGFFKHTGDEHIDEVHVEAPFVLDAQG